jgi:gliding motility-associated lipoprotein GldH
MSIKRLISSCALAMILFMGCQSIDLYERSVSIPDQEWKSSFRPSFSFEVKDTAAAYQLYIILRHSNRYAYNNLWVNLTVQLPDSSARRFEQIELPLAAGEAGWLGSGLDDIYEHRIAIVLDPEKFNTRKPGKYSFILEQVMREDPLHEVYNAGIRLEKKAR